MALRPEKSEVKGFTLVELLVVIAIMALLLSVIVPALRNAKLCAKQVVCASKMRQWTLATLAYAGEHENAIPPYADTCDTTNNDNPLDVETYWHKRLSPYLTREDYGQWGMKDMRRCPMGRANWGDKAAWIGVYYAEHQPDRSPFIYLNRWNGSTLIKMCDPFKTTSVQMPAHYLMMMDVQRDNVFEPVHWIWDTDYDGDGMNDSRSGIINAGLGPYNRGQPKIHRGGCNVSLFDGHVEWIRYETFWEIAPDGYPVHSYWWNQNRP